ncbi:hypothetical protein [Serratia sp. UGAL515B_01]|uniref:hypothetical protein n=1 Tax=Serratia sp. UGAL515B_01 TaxID=2986763 RepID=UPI002954E0C4|nr:hypothetical protein [Serratia sp. UGAL515B_01]
MLTYEDLKSDVEKICKDKFTITKYHPNPNISSTLAWDAIPDKIKEILIDLRYRGDYSSRTRKYIQRPAYSGDLQSFGRVIADRSIWLSVPDDRFKRRVEFYESN